MPISDRLIEHIALVDVDLGHAMRMTNQQRNEPMMTVIGSDGINVIDGHHRLRGLINDKRPYVKAYMLKPETIGYMQVQCYEVGTDGTLTLNQA